MNNYTVNELADMHMVQLTQMHLQPGGFIHVLFTSVDHRIRETGMVKIGSGRRCNVQHHQFENEVLAHLEGKPCTRTRHLVGKLRVSCMCGTSMVFIPTTNKRFKSGTHKTKPRVPHCHWYFEKCQHEPDFPSFVMYSDEATFAEEGIFNSKNNIGRTNTNIYAIYECGHQDKFKVNVWVGVLDNHMTTIHLAKLIKPKQIAHLFA
ncbi:hypothetical protein PR048_001821 [Dryococelus australis]|uniref:PiggyBac transposable element-derived protein domain-containing protein n=1 Tax=Dryococelus australis TaxID=614101 RepID=A0ABQ9IID9_9NEOP|nr:hypothetical protein PR048_001821 [Dryococelus australis]